MSMSFNNENGFYVTALDNGCFGIVSYENGEVVWFHENHYKVTKKCDKMNKRNR